jgi:hypothetical protein
MYELYRNEIPANQVSTAIMNNYSDSEVVELIDIFLKMVSIDYIRPIYHGVSPNTLEKLSGIRNHYQTRNQMSIKQKYCAIATIIDNWGEFIRVYRFRESHNRF